MNKLSTDLLLEAYIHAIELNLSKEFIDLLGNELQKRFLISDDSHFINVTGHAS
jgi:Sporulation inhibitor A